MERGDSYTFVPHALLMTEPGTSYMPKDAPRRVTGTAERIHAAHHWFRVAWTMRGRTYHECFPLAESESDTPFEEEPHKHGYHKTRRSNGRFGKAKWS